MPINDEEMVMSEKDYVITETVLNPKASPEEIHSFLKRHRLTGHTTTTHMRQGGVQNIVVTQRTLASPSKREKIKELLDI